MIVDVGRQFTPGSNWKPIFQDLAPFLPGTIKLRKAQISPL